MDAGAKGECSQTQNAKHSAHKLHNTKFKYRYRQRISQNKESTDKKWG